MTENGRRAPACLVASLLRPTLRAGLLPGGEDPVEVEEDYKPVPPSRPDEVRAIPPDIIGGGGSIACREPEDLRHGVHQMPMFCPAMWTTMMRPPHVRTVAMCRHELRSVH